MSKDTEELIKALTRASKLLKENASLFGKDRDRILDNVDYFEGVLKQCEQ